VLLDVPAHFVGVLGTVAPTGVPNIYPPIFQNPKQLTTYQLSFKFTTYFAELKKNSLNIENKA
jgi:hypothetical protein